MGEVARQLEEQPVEISSVPLDMLNYVWSSQIDMIEKGLARGQGDCTTAQDMFRGIIGGKHNLWVAHRGSEIMAVIVNQVQATSKSTKVYVDLVAGSGLALWYPMLKQLLLDLMDIVGADCVEASCRPGLAKFLKADGWSQKAIIMELK